MLAAVKQLLSSHEDRIREFVDAAVTTSHAAMVKDLQQKHHALLKENEELRTLYQSETQEHRACIENLGKVLTVMARMTECSSSDNRVDS